MTSNLAVKIQEHVMRGGRIESQGDDLAVVVYGKRPNHVLHLLLTVFTLGLWLPVWAIIDSTQRERRVILTVDESGHVREREHKQAVSLYQKWRQRRAT